MPVIYDNVRRWLAEIRLFDTPGDSGHDPKLVDEVTA
jgi:hypothetical protein